MNPASVPKSSRMRVRAMQVGLFALLASTVAPLTVVEVQAAPRTVSQVIALTPAASASVTAAERAEIGLTATSGALSRSAAVKTPLAYSMVGFEIPAGTREVWLRTSTDGLVWSDWSEAEPMHDEDGPDPGTAEAAAAGDVTRWTEPVWVDEAHHLEVLIVGGDVAEVSATLIDSKGLSTDEVVRSRVVRPATADAASPGPHIRTRAEWGADESLRKREPTYDPVIDMGIVHHTAHRADTDANRYSPSDVPALIRAIYQYHTQALGWNDIGYNILVDRFGTIWEGRYGGLDRGVRGAHAAGFNTGSFGISVIGNFANENPTEASLRALEDVIAWKSAIHGFEPLGYTTRDGVRRRSIVGHKDVGNTACPGRIHNVLGTIRENAQQIWPQYAMTFPDVPTNSVHRPQILDLFERKVISGCASNAYCPSRAVTRGQAATLVARTLGIPFEYGQRFPDVPDSYVHAGAINAVASRGILSGYDDGTFRPGQPMIRAHFAVLLARALELPPGEGTHFVDVPPGYAHGPAIYALAERGLTSGCTSDQFCPGSSIRRDQAATFVHRMLAYRGPSPSPSPSPSAHGGAAGNDGAG